MDEIILKVRVPEDWNEGLRKAMERRLVIDVVNELQKRIEEAKRFEEIITGIHVEKKKAKEIEDEFEKDLARRYGWSEWKWCWITTSFFRPFTTEGFHTGCSW